MARKLTVQHAVWNSRLVYLCSSVLALTAGLTVSAAFAQTTPVNPPPATTATAPATTPAAKQPTTKQTTAPATAPAAKQTATTAATPSATAAPAAKPAQPVASAPVPNPKPDAAGAKPTVNALPTTNVVANANSGRMLNPYSEQPETKYIKYPVTSNGCKDARAPGKP